MCSCFPSSLSEGLHPNCSSGGSAYEHCALDFVNKITEGSFLHELKHQKNKFESGPWQCWSMVSKRYGGEREGALAHVAPAMLLLALTEVGQRVQFPQQTLDALSGGCTSGPNAAWPRPASAAMITEIRIGIVIPGWRHGRRHAGRVMQRACRRLQGCSLFELIDRLLCSSQTVSQLLNEPKFLISEP